jgi:hypothetical protein
MTIVQYLWDSPQLVEYFDEYARERGEPEPGFDKVVGDLTAAMSRNGITWFTIALTEHDLYTEPQFQFIEHEREDWNQIVMIMIQNIADKQAQRLLGDL